LVGDFRGDGHPLVGLRRNDQVIDLFETGRGRIDTPWVIAVDPLAQTPQVQSLLNDAKAIDLDGDGADELVVQYAARVINNQSDALPEVWIYRGGPGFRGDTPTVILKDTEFYAASFGVFLVVGRLDDDPYADLMTGVRYSDGTRQYQKLKIWFGREGSPWNWSAPDRQIVFGDLFALDCDGDAMLDLAIATTPFLKPGTPADVDRAVPFLQRQVDARSSAGLDRHRSHSGQQRLQLSAIGGFPQRQRTALRDAPAGDDSDTAAGRRPERTRSLLRRLWRAGAIVETDP